MKTLSAKAVLVLGVLIVPAHSSAGEGVMLEGLVDCGVWVQARQTQRAGILEGNLIGFINGLALGRGVPPSNGRGARRRLGRLWTSPPSTLCGRHCAKPQSRYPRQQKANCAHAALLSRAWNLDGQLGLEHERLSPRVCHTHPQAGGFGVTQKRLRLRVCAAGQTLNQASGQFMRLA